jgi:adenylosuccinate synthase
MKNKTGFVDFYIGGQWGDEGKGKIVDLMVSNYHAIARFNGGPNAGHTIKKGAIEFTNHNLPSGMFHKNVRMLIGGNVVVDPVQLMKEITDARKIGYDVTGRIEISENAILASPLAKYFDAAEEVLRGSDKIGTTGRGIGYSYKEDISRNGFKMVDILSIDFEKKAEKLIGLQFELLSEYYGQHGYDMDTVSQSITSAEKHGMKL